jgi:hypothetical protein
MLLSSRDKGLTNQVVSYLLGEIPNVRGEMYPKQTMKENAPF